jgi:signal peptide peptidase SppA
MQGLHREHSRVLEAFYSTPWAILPETFNAMQTILHRWVAGDRLERSEIDLACSPHRAGGIREYWEGVQSTAGIKSHYGLRAEHNQRKAAGPRGVGVIQMFGVLSQRSGLTDTSEPLQGVDPIRETFTRMLKDDQIGTIVLEIDSPGGSVMGIQELWDAIFAARGEKKVVAVANSLAASAAYYVATAAEEIVVTPSGAVGSIGVLAAHVDQSKLLEEQGVNVTLVSAGKFKVEGNQFEPLGDDARAAMQGIVDTYYDAFVQAVAKGRDVRPSEVRGGFGEGRILTAKNAKAEGMVDRVDTLEATVARLMSSPQAQRPLKANAKLALEAAAI